ncbi:MAG: hypothetical protein FWE32_07125 [Oscillospiraceae bacterium]|nr:hypothetical protein [Oscillospiraceae bacterium]
MQKIVIVINGQGGVGKDAICEIVARRYRAENVSSIDPIKAIARQHGWQGEKDPKARKFLADLKQAFIAYNDLPGRYLADKYAAFVANPAGQILFVHIREADQIDAFKRSVSEKCVTLLVKGKNSETFGNAADDAAGDYTYDYCYPNTGRLEDLEADALRFFGELLEREKINEY